MSPAAPAQPDPPPTLLLIVGPIAGGKSTVARALARRLRQHSEQVALVELDQIAEMALPTLPDWAFAHRIFSSVVGQWLRSPLTVVIAEGPGSPSEVGGVLAQVPDGIEVITVVLTSTFEIAFARARDDPTRGVSREHSFLLREFERWATDMPLIEHSVLIDTGTASVEDSVSVIHSELGKRRD